MLVLYFVRVCVEERERRGIFKAWGFPLAQILAGSKRGCTYDYKLERDGTIKFI